MERIIRKSLWGYVLLISPLISLCSCEPSLEDFEDYSIVDKDPEVLLHRASDNFLNLSMDSCFSDEISRVNGLEVDILLSSDQTIWLRHDDFHVDASGDTLLFNDLSDSIIKSKRLATVTLEELFMHITSNNLSVSVSLDLKNGRSLKSDTKDLLIQEAKQINQLQKTYQINQLMVETYNDDVQSILSVSGQIEVYFFCWGNVRGHLLKVLNKGYNGITISQNLISKDEIRLVNSKGIKVQIWTPKSEEDLAKCIDLRPQYIQSDFIPF